MSNSPPKRTLYDRIVICWWIGAIVGPFFLSKENLSFLYYLVYVLFGISYALYYCEKYKDESKVARYLFKGTRPRSYRPWDGEGIHIAQGLGIFCFGLAVLVWSIYEEYELRWVIDAINDWYYTNIDTTNKW